MTFLETHISFGSSWDADLRYSSFENVYIYHAYPLSYHEKKEALLQYIPIVDSYSLPMTYLSSSRVPTTFLRFVIH